MCKNQFSVGKKVYCKTDNTICKWTRIEIICPAFLDCEELEEKK